MLLITDHLAASAEFVLHRALHLGLRPWTPAARRADGADEHPRRQQPQGRGAAVVLVSLARGLAHWRAIAARSGVSLARHLEAGSLAFVDGLAISAYAGQGGGGGGGEVGGEAGCTRCPPLFSRDGGDAAPTLRGLYDVIQRALPPVGGSSAAETEPPRPAPVVIIDDITLLSSIGVADAAVARFIRALRALCRRRAAGLIIRAHAAAAARQHAEAMPFGSDVLRALIECSHRHVEVRPLASGRSGAISGEVAVHRGGLGIGSGGDDDDGAGGKMGRGTAVHYRLDGSGAVFFQKGMSAGIL
ncbi:hypothetical protein BU17DRAFT_56027 [Hysterangium stoloniferum]|nr:hypothetical protein BU17DRAFT_56027 [Hysterangium stoloniferum]